jgi:hypothetical protein
MGSIFGVVWGGVTSNIVALSVILPLTVFLVYVFIIISSIFWMRSKYKRFLTELRNFIESNNQQCFLSRGVQFLVKTRIVYGYKRRFEHVYLEVVVNPNASGSSGGGMQQPLLQQQPVFQPTYQSNMATGKSYPQTVQSQYYQQQ